MASKILKAFIIGPDPENILKDTDALSALVSTSQDSLISKMVKGRHGELTWEQFLSKSTDNINLQPYIGKIQEISRTMKQIGMPDNILTDFGTFDQKMNAIRRKYGLYRALLAKQKTLMTKTRDQISVADKMLLDNIPTIKQNMATLKINMDTLKTQMADKLTAHIGKIQTDSLNEHEYLLTDETLINIAESLAIIKPDEKSLHIEDLSSKKKVM